MQLILWPVGYLWDLNIPDNIPGRINAELVWIPVSQSGALIAIGGVLYSDAVTAPNLTATQATASVSLLAVLPLSSSRMETVDSISTGHSMKQVLPSCRSCPFMILELEITNGDYLYSRCPITLDDIDSNQVHATNVW
jgi:hypothetical protein